MVWGELECDVTLAETAALGNGSGDEGAGFATRIQPAIGSRKKHRGPGTIRAAATP